MDFFIEPRYKTDVEEALDADEEEDDTSFGLINEQERHSEPLSLRKYKKPVAAHSRYSSLWSRSSSESSGSSDVDLEPIAFSEDPKFGKYVGGQDSSWSR